MQMSKMGYANEQALHRHLAARILPHPHPPLPLPLPLPQRPGETRRNQEKPGEKRIKRIERGGKEMSAVVTAGADRWRGGDLPYIFPSSDRIILRRPHGG